MKIDINLIKKLREETGVAILRVREVLAETGGNEKKALAILKKEGLAKVAKREGRETGQGKVFAYSHHTGKVVGVVELFSETDFVARNDLFETLGKGLAMQAASMGSKDFATKEFIKDPAQKVGDLLKELSAKTGENIKLGRVYQIELGK